MPNLYVHAALESLITASTVWPRLDFHLERPKREGTHRRIANWNTGTLKQLVAAAAAFRAFLLSSTLAPCSMTPISSCFLTAARRPQKLDNDTLKACRRRRRGLFLTAEPRTSTERAIMASLAVTSSELDKTALWPHQSSTPSRSQLCGSGGWRRKKK